MKIQISDDMKMVIEELYNSYFFPAKFDELCDLLEGFKSWKLEEMDGTWKQYWFKTKSRYGIYVTTEKDFITCINIFDTDEKLLIGYQGEDFYYKI